MKVSAKLALGAMALLTGSLAATADETPREPVSVAAIPANIRCVGENSVAMTSDAEQALPLKTVASLSCNQLVYVLADNEGYTAHVRTDDGREGYVARPFLSMNTAAAAAVRRPQPVNATPVNGVVRWESGAPGCDRFITKGHNVVSATADGVTVQVALEDTGWKLRATILISNKSGRPMDVLPNLVSLDELQPGLKPLPQVSAAKLSHVSAHQLLWTQIGAEPSPSASATHAKLVATSYRTDTPDYFSEHVAIASYDERVATVPQGENLKQMALKRGALEAGQKTAGLVWFERGSNAKEMSLRVPVGNLVFDFPLSFANKK